MSAARDRKTDQNLRFTESCGQRQLPGVTGRGLWLSGLNGAGKTTAIRMLTGLSRPTAGNAWVLGYDLHTDLVRVKKAVGVMPEASNLYNLWEKREVPFAEPSQGMKRALTVAAALLYHPRLLLLDKPTTGLDVLSVHSLRALTEFAIHLKRQQLVREEETRYHAGFHARGYSDSAPLRPNGPGRGCEH